MKNEKKDDAEEDFAKASELSYQPVEDDETEKILKAVSKGAALGVFAGVLISQLPGNDNFLFGYYVRDGGLVILGYAGVGLVTGALAGWLYRLLPGKK